MPSNNIVGEKSRYVNGISDTENPLTGFDRENEPVTECSKQGNPLHNGNTSVLDTDSYAHTFDTEWRDDIRYLRKQLPYIPSTLRARVKNIYNRLLKSAIQPHFQANSFLRKLVNELKALPIDITLPDSQIESLARQRADMAYQITCNIMHDNGTPEEVLETLESLLRQNGLKARKGKYISGDIARYCCEKFWYKRLRRHQQKLFEQVARSLGQVHRSAQIYISDTNLKLRRNRKRVNQLFLNMLEAINEEGDIVSLKDASNSNISNPENRRHEIMCRLSGMEAYGDKHGYKALFLTLTSPSKMHATHSSGKKNEKYEGYSVKEVHDYFQGLWVNMRSSFDRGGIDYFGLRVVEPHHDGTPHWHLLIFVRPEHQQAFISTFNRYALEMDGDEPGAKKRRTKVELISKKKGSAVAYIAKYISKNINGFGVDKDRYQNDAKDSAERICEWAGLHGIRQFQQFGCPPVTLWREARRLTLEQIKQSPIFEAADEGDWCKFMEALGGVNLRSKDRQAVLHKEFIEQEGGYLEPIGWVIKGIKLGVEVYISRPHEWKIRCIKNHMSQATSAESKSSPLGVL